MQLYNPIIVLAILFITIFLSELIAKTSWGKKLSAALLVIIFGAFLANLGIIPTASNAIPLYDVIFKYIAPLSIFYLVLGVNLRKVKQAGLPMLILFLLGSTATVIGVFASYLIVQPEQVLGEHAAPIAGMFAGTYTGGSINFNAVALHFKVNETGILYAGSVAVDNIITAIWVLITIALPRVMRVVWPGKEIQSAKAETAHLNYPDKNHLDYRDLIMLLPMGLVALVGSMVISTIWPAIPSILVITSFGLILAQFDRFHNMVGSRPLGLYLVYLFLVVIGAYCELSAISELADVGLQLLLFVGLTVLIHGAVIITIGRLFFTDWTMIAIASQANIGGGTTAMALAETFDREELIVPAILVGTLGNALGTYLGFFVATVL